MFSTRFQKIVVLLFVIVLCFCARHPASYPISEKKTIHAESKSGSTDGKKKNKPIKYLGPMPPDFVTFCSVNHIETYCDWLESQEGDLDSCEEPKKLEKNPDYLSEYCCEKGMISYVVGLKRGYWDWKINPEMRIPNEQFEFKVCCDPGATPPFNLLPIEGKELVKGYNDIKQFPPWVLTFQSHAGDWFLKDFDMPERPKSRVMKLCCLRADDSICINTDCDFYLERDIYWKIINLDFTAATNEYSRKPIIHKTMHGDEMSCEREYIKYELDLCLIDSDDSDKNRMWKLEDFDLECEESENIILCLLHSKPANKNSTSNREYIESTSCNERIEFVTCSRWWWIPTHLLPLDTEEIYKDYNYDDFLPWVVKRHVKWKDLKRSK